VFRGEAAVILTLLEKDVAAFSRIGVPVELLVDAGVRRVTHNEAYAVLGSNRSGDLAGILFPYRNPKSGQLVTSRLRRDNPEVDAQGKVQNKYISPYGDRRHLYFPPGSAELLADTAIRIVVVEAEKSALALTALAFRVGCRVLVIALGGCWGWKGKIGIVSGPDSERCEEKGILPDFALMEWGGRDIVICFDVNAATNSKVRTARGALAEQLIARGARVRIANLPAELAVAGINGPDDYLAHCGDAAMLAVLDTARASSEVATADAQDCVEKLESDPSAIKKLDEQAHVLDAVAAMELPEQRKALASRVAKALKRPVGEIRTAIQGRVAKRLDAQADAKQSVRRAYLLGLKVRPIELVNKLEQFFAERAHLPFGAALLLAIWALNTWTFDYFDSTPYLAIESATPGCGKSTILRLLAAVSARPEITVAMSEAVLFRTVDECHPTLLVDEAELLQGRTERAEAIRHVAHAGYTKGGVVKRCEGDRNELRVFQVYCPKAFAAIGGLRGALLDRCIVVHVEKAPRGQVRRTTRQRRLTKAAEPLRDLLEAYSVQAEDCLMKAYDQEPDAGYWVELADREAELWGPLLIHARLIARTLESRLLAAANNYCKQKQQIQAQDRNVVLASELLEVVFHYEGEEFTPGSLVSQLADKDGWAEEMCKRDEKARAARVGRFLGGFRMPGKKHKRSGTTYSRNEVISKLSLHIPLETVTSITSGTEAMESARNVVNGGDRTTVIKSVTSKDTENEGTGDSVTDVTVLASDSGDPKPWTPPATSSRFASDGTHAVEPAIADAEVVEVDL
jgi:hypothetical protein